MHLIELIPPDSKYRISCHLWSNWWIIIHIHWRKKLGQQFCTVLCTEKLKWCCIYVWWCGVDTLFNKDHPFVVTNYFIQIDLSAFKIWFGAKSAFGLTSLCIIEKMGRHTREIVCTKHIRTYVLGYGSWWEVTESSTLVSLDLHVCHLKCGFNGNFGVRLILLQDRHLMQYIFHVTEPKTCLTTSPCL